VAFHPELSYGIYRTGEGAVIVAEELAERVAAQVGRQLGAPFARVKGEQLEGLRFRHPLYDRDSLAVLGDYVTLEQGTGAVHTAPGHGSDDFLTGVRYGLEVYAPVGPSGHFNEDVQIFGGLGVFDANPRIEQALLDKGRLWHRERYEHTYPHCWRCHNPVIFLATSQWFIKMEAPLRVGSETGDDAHTLRAGALAAIQRVEWFPEWGEERIHNMLAHRPDWCISRQRSWGVPIPAVYCTNCQEALLTPELARRASDVFERHGADAWYEEEIGTFLPPGLVCPKCGGRSFERERDILDVWFDSGSSHEGVLALRPDLRWPADVYLEGTDQYRGWFHSSLLIGVGTRGQAPFRQVITHGFVVDEQGRKMSKSRGTGVEPQEVIEQSGAEILRLWSAMVDYRDEVRLGREILARVVESYRKIRNTLRILAANLHDFDPARDAVPLDRLEEVDRYALARYAETARRALKAYDRYDFPVVFQSVANLMTVDLSAFYIDVSKDRLYTFATASHERRSAQTAIWTVADGLTRLLAPILPVTTDELWRRLPGAREDSVHLADFPERVEALADASLLDRWGRLIRIRDAVNAEIERLRQRKVVGTSLEARLTLTASGTTADLLERYREDLPMIFITSQVTLRRAAGASSADPGGDATDEPGRHLEPGGDVVVEVARAEGVKCPRCWRYVTSVSSRGDREGLCDRCVGALAEGLTPVAD
jgi:isoleucyl-tRNA synthetase